MGMKGAFLVGAREELFSVFAHLNKNGFLFHAHSFFATFSTMLVESCHDYSQHFGNKTGL